MKDNTSVADKRSKMRYVVLFHVTLIELSAGFTLFPETLVGLLNAIASKCEMIQVKVDTRDANCKPHKRIAEITVSEACRDDDEQPSVLNLLEFDDGNSLYLDSDYWRSSVHTTCLYLFNTKEMPRKISPDQNLYINSSQSQDNNNITQFLEEIAERWMAHPDGSHESNRIDADASSRDGLVSECNPYINSFAEQNSDHTSLNAIFGLNDCSEDDDRGGHVPIDIDADEPHVTSCDFERLREIERLLLAHPRWQSNGFPIAALKTLRRWVEYRPMRYITPLSSKLVHNKNTASTSVRSLEPVTTPTKGLPPPPSHTKINGSSRCDTFTVVRMDTGTRQNWKTGVDSSKPICAKATEMPLYVSSYQRLLD